MISDGDDAAETAYISVPEIHGEIESSRTTEEIVGVAGNDFIKLREKKVWAKSSASYGAAEIGMEAHMIPR